MKCDIIVFQLPIIRILESHKQHTFTGSQISELSFSFNSAVKIQITGVRVPVLLGSDRSDCINFRIDDISFQNNLRIIFPDFPSGYSIVGSALHCLLKPDRIPIVIPKQITDFYCFNIDALMLRRYENKKFLRAGKHPKGSAKRTKEQDVKFAGVLEQILNTYVLKAGEIRPSFCFQTVEIA